MSSLLVLAQEGEGIALFGGLFLLWMLLIAVGFVLWLWALIDAIRNPALDGTMRLVWVLVIVFTYALGAILYLVIGRNMATRAPGDPLR